MLSAGPAVSTSTPEAEAFVRFCYQRRRVGWPELYDEMCAVATRGPLPGDGQRRAGGDRRGVQPVRDAAAGQLVDAGRRGGAGGSQGGQGRRDAR